MVLSAAVLTIVFYIVQQLGMMLGFGSEVVLLLTYLFGRRNGVINETEDHIAHSIYRILVASLFLIVVSGVGITLIHATSGDLSTVLQPAYLFKWALIVLAIVLAALMRGSRLWNAFLEGFAGATWGALFLIHIFAPVTTIYFLIELYGEWLIGVLVVWYILVLILRPSRVGQQKGSPKGNSSQPTMTFVQTSPRPKKEQAAPVVIQLQPNISPVSAQEHRPIPPFPPNVLEHEHTSGLPTIRVMPKTPEELQTHQQRELLPSQ